MKIGTKKKTPNKTKEPEIVIIDESPEEKQEELQQQVETLEERIVRLSGELAELENRKNQLAQLTDEAIRKRAQTFIDMLDRRMAESEQRIAYNILDFIGNCPAWEMLKISEQTHNKSDAARTFSKALSEGWRYVGYYMNPDQNQIPRERYTLLVRPKGGPITDTQYLKFYEEFKERRDAADAKRKKEAADAAKAAKTNLSQPKAKVAEAPKSQGKLKIKPKGK